MEKRETKQLAIKVFSRQYRRSNKQVKGEILSRLVNATGYSRKHLMAVLRYPKIKKKIYRRRPSKYRPVVKHLRKLWAISNYACGQRLKPMIPVYLLAMETHEGWRLKKKEKRLLVDISSATIDRFLSYDRQKISLRGKTRTKPGSLLKHQIPIRTFADWDEKEQGFLEIDSVHHCWFSLAGEYLFTLDTTDVATGWNECVAHMGKSEKHTVEALETIKKRLPFSLKGIDFDTGGEFVNYHLIRWSQREQITYTRAREEKKNDQCYVEQQNYSVVRRFVGYQRLDTEEQKQILNRLYELLSDYQNFFHPVMRLREKTRNGTKLTRKYDPPKTAYQRILEYAKISEESKTKLKERFSRLNPKRLLLEITRLGQKLSQKP